MNFTTAHQQPHQQRCSHASRRQPPAAVHVRPPSRRRLSAAVRCCCCCSLACQTLTAAQLRCGASPKKKKRRLDWQKSISITTPPAQQPGRAARLLSTCITRSITTVRSATHPSMPNLTAKQTPCYPGLVYGASRMIAGYHREQR